MKSMNKDVKIWLICFAIGAGLFVSVMAILALGIWILA
jgi:hypothetical protein